MLCEKDIMKTIYGGEPKNPPAYCRRHCGYLTVKEMKRHECLRKQCRHLCKYEHPYWQQREIMKAKKQEKRNQLEDRIKEVMHA